MLGKRSKLAFPRLGLAISKKHVKAAAARNRIKRVARESFRLHQGLLGNLDVVVLAKPGTGAKANRDLFRSLLRHWNTLAARCEKSRFS